MRTAIALLSTALIASACHAGGHAEETRPTVQRNIEVSGPFDRIALAGSPDVVVAVGAAPSIRAEGDADTLDRLEITIAGGQLHIGLRNSSGNWFSWGHHRGVTVHVTVPALAAASITGSGDMRIDRVEGPRFAGSVTGSGDMNVAAVAVGEANFSITGSGDITAAGRAQQASVTVAGSGDLRLVGLEAATATVSLVGSGDIGVHATQTAAVELRGSGDVTVAGPAHCTISKSGSGDVHCGG
jgi:Putative auto-transporter adhesin, head GIN domain